MEFTVLDMVQNILSAMSSDEVNSISDTTESMQVATILQNKYYDILARGDLPEHEQFFQLTASNSTATPTLMYLPNGVSRLDWVKYFDTNVNDSESNQYDQYGAYSHDVNTDIVQGISWTSTSTTSVTMGLGNQTFTVASSTLPVTIGQWVSAANGTNIMFGTAVSYSGTTLVINVTSMIGTGTFNSWIIEGNNGPGSPPGYKYVRVLPVRNFINMINKFDPLETDVESYKFTQGGNTYTFYYKNDRQPTNCCVISNYYIVFDSYDNTQENSLQASKTLGYGQLVPEFLLEDNFIPDLDDQQFPLLINEAKALAFYELKQQPHAKAEQEIKRQWAVVQKSKSISNKPGYFDQLPAFGRVPRTGGYGLPYGPYTWMRERGSYN